MIAEWFPDHPPLYDLTKTYAENGSQGPFFDGKIPKRPGFKPLDFLGFEVLSPIGIPAGPLLNSRWIALASKLEYDILTYKTIRSKAHPGHSLPNMIYVERIGDHRARAKDEMPLSLNDLSITNSFGMPSQSADFLVEDIEKANRSLKKGQVMIVSVVGSMNQDRAFIDDFIQVALFAKEAGAKIIEANFSCPNVCKKEGMLYLSTDTVFEFTRKISQALGSTPLIIKVGHFPNRTLLEHVCVAAAKGGARAICGLNSMSMKVVDPKGKPALGEDRKTSGICGSTLRPSALHFIRDAATCIANQKLDLTLIGCGGIMHTEHFHSFFEAGAHIAMTATGFLWDPYLGYKYHAETFPHS